MILVTEDGLSDSERRERFRLIRETLYAMGVNSTNRLRIAIKLSAGNGLSPEERMQLIAEGWESSVLIWGEMDVRLWRYLKFFKLQAVGKATPWMWPKDRPEWKHCDRIMIFRGGATPNGSWTLSEDVAIGFAKGHFGLPKTKLFEGKILTKNVLLYLTGREEEGRGEEEIVPVRFNAVQSVKDLEF
jgi:hypothetical protein